MIALGLHLGFAAGFKFLKAPKSLCGTKGNVDVEMDPPELLRLRCLREAEEKVRQGLLHVGMSVKKARGGKTWN